MSAAGAARRLLVRDLEQLASPAGSASPLRGAALADVEVVEDGYVLARVTPSRRSAACATSVRSRVRSRSSTDAASARSPAGRLPHPRVLRRRPRRRVRPARRRCELRGASRGGGGIMSTVRATRAAEESALEAAVARHRDWMLRAGTTTFESKSGYGLDRETELASLEGDPCCRRCSDLARGARGSRPSSRTQIRTSTSRWLKCSRGREARRGGRRFPGAGRVRRRAGEALSGSVRRAGLRTQASRRPVHRAGRSRARDRPRRPLRRPSRGHRSQRGRCSRREHGHRGAPAGERALSRPADASRRALAEAGAIVALATDFNPGSAFCESLPLVCSLAAATQLGLSPAQALSASLVQRGARPRPRRRIGRLAPGFAGGRRPARRARLALPRVPPRRDLVRGARPRGRPAELRLGLACRPGSSGGGEQKARRHEYEYVYVDDAGNEVDVDPDELRAEKEARRETRGSKVESRKPAAARGQRAVQPPSWRRSARRRGRARAAADRGHDALQPRGATRTADRAGRVPPRVLHPLQLLHRLVRVPPVPQATRAPGDHEPRLAAGRQQPRCCRRLAPAIVALPGPRSEHQQDPAPCSVEIECLSSTSKEKKEPESPSITSSPTRRGPCRR